MSYGLIATLIVVAIVVGAITTKKCEAFLIAGSMVGAVVLWKQDFLSKWVSTLEGVMSDEAYVILICGLFGSLVALLTASKGSFGFTKIVSKLCNSERKTLFTTFILGILIFVDDYLNVLSIGTAMKGTYDKKKVPREALAYLLDSTGAPVCVLIPFSSWAAYFGAIFLQQDCVKKLAGGSLMKTYMMAIPYCVYPLVASVGANIVLVMAAILSGCAFGNHACFYCDTTVLASNGAGIDNLEHAGSQLPYVLIGAGVSIIGFLILGFVR